MLKLIPIMASMLVAFPSAPRNYRIDGQGETYVFNRNVCSEVTVDWGFPPSLPWQAGKQTIFLGIRHLEFRVLPHDDRRLAVSPIAAYGGLPPQTAPHKYAIGVAFPGAFSPITDAEWDNATEFKMPGMTESADLWVLPVRYAEIEYRGKTYTPPLPMLLDHLLSKDRRAIIITSASRRVGPQLPWKLGNDFAWNGYVAVELCDTNSGTCSTIVRIKYHELGAFEMGRVTWLSSNIFVVEPVWRDQALLVCEAHHAR